MFSRDGLDAPRKPPEDRGGGVRGVVVFCAFALILLFVAMWLAPMRVGGAVQPNPYVLIWTPLSLVPLLFITLALRGLERWTTSRGARVVAAVVVAAVMLLALELLVRLFGGADTVSQERRLETVRWLHDSGFTYSAAEPLVIAIAAQLQILLSPLSLRFLKWTGAA